MSTSGRARPGAAARDREGISEFRRSSPLLLLLLFLLGGYGGKMIMTMTVHPQEARKL